jgi:hypothetical protein
MKIILQQKPTGLRGFENMKDKILKWFGNGEVGSSSTAMALAVAGIDSEEKSHPHDPGDFNRCLLFLQSVPEARNHLNKVSQLSPYWGAVISNFDKIEKSFIEEVGLDWVRGNSAPKTYQLMRSILDQIEESDLRTARFGDMTIQIRD